MSWIMFFFAVEAGLLSGQEGLGHLGYYYPDKSTYITLEVEAQVGPWFIGGDVETHQTFLGTGFAPYRALYTFNTGFRWRAFEIGWRHMCDHPVISASVDPSPKSGGWDRIYLRVEVEK